MDEMYANFATKCGEIATGDFGVELLALNQGTL